MISDLPFEVTEQLKYCEIQMLRAFIAACDKLNIDYFLIGGTLLGAIRHKGFIPWDDDIDVGMKRRDYEIFIRNAQKLLPNEYFIQTNESDPKYPYNFAKLRNSNTTFIESSMKKFKMNHGVFIDIFPFDEYPDQKIKAFILEFRKKFLNRRIMSDFYYNQKLKYSFSGKVLLSVSKIMYRDRNDAIADKEKLMKSEKKSSLVANYCGAWGAKEVYPREWIEKFCAVTFEGIQAKAPYEYDKLLRHVYGNYMQLPPKNKRVSHHYTEVIDLDRPYTDYIDIGETTNATKA